MQKTLREEVLKIILSLTKQEANEAEVTDGQEYESELTKMADPATEKGVNEVSSGEKNLDDEFKTKVSVKTAKKVTKKSSSKRKKSKKNNKRKKTSKSKKH